MGSFLNCLNHHGHSPFVLLVLNDCLQTGGTCCFFIFMLRCKTSIWVGNWPIWLFINHGLLAEEVWIWKYVDTKGPLLHQKAFFTRKNPGVYVATTVGYVLLCFKLLLWVLNAALLLLSFNPPSASFCPFIHPHPLLLQTFSIILSSLICIHLYFYK